MEDMARLALVEQSVRDGEKFKNILYYLLRHMTHILNNPYDYELRTLKTVILEDVLKHDAFSDYLKYVGYRPEGRNLVYATELPVSKLRMAQAAIVRKIVFCYGDMAFSLFESAVGQTEKLLLTPTNILTTRNPFLKKIQYLFNQVLEYEDERLKVLARQQIPLVTLQLLALDRIREQQKIIKSGETKDLDLSFDVALLMELLSWFKYKFFSSVDDPPCDNCGGPNIFSSRTMIAFWKEPCWMEINSCDECRAHCNVARTLILRRRSRCSEWVNCFTQMCRALGYDTRYVFDTSNPVHQHAWCEIFDYDSKTWLHADPCEAVLNTPLMYEHGCGKKMSYVIAVSRDDLQDVTWRYTLNHKQTLARRTYCSEKELIDTLLSLRDHRQRHLSKVRRNYLAKRNLMELISIMQEKKPTDYESQGRIPGSQQWRRNRVEFGRGHTFTFTRPGYCRVQYNSGTDMYCVSEKGRGQEDVYLGGWTSGVFHAENICRKIDHELKKVYLGTEDFEMGGSVSWKFMASEGRRLTDITLRVRFRQFRSGIQWTARYDSKEPEPLIFDVNQTAMVSSCACVLIRAELHWERCLNVVWQHPRLCHSTLLYAQSAFELRATCV